MVGLIFLNIPISYPLTLVCNQCRAIAIKQICCMTTVLLKISNCIIDLLSIDMYIELESCPKIKRIMFMYDWLIHHYEL